MNTTEYTKREIEIIALTIRQQIGAQALMAQAARGYAYGPMLAEDDATQLPGFAFTAKPRTRLVRVHILLDPSDTYRVVLRNPKTHAVTWSRTDVYADDLRELILFLDRELSA